MLDFFFFSSPLHPPSPHDPTWIHIECDCIHQHLLPSSALLVWLWLFNLLKCTLTFFFLFFFPLWHWESGTGLELRDQTPVDRDTLTSSCLIDARNFEFIELFFLLVAYLPLRVYTGSVLWATCALNSQEQSGKTIWLKTKHNSPQSPVVCSPILCTLTGSVLSHATNTFIFLTCMPKCKYAVLLFKSGNGKWNFVWQQ